MQNRSKSAIRQLEQYIKGYIASEERLTSIIPPHVYEKHVNQDERTLANRYDKEKGRIGYSSTYFDEYAMRSAIKNNIASNAYSIAKWVMNDYARRRQEFDVSLPEVVGRGYSSDLEERYSAVSKTVLEKDDYNKLGFRIVTSYPSLDLSRYPRGLSLIHSTGFKYDMPVYMKDRLTEIEKLRCFCKEELGIKEVYLSRDKTTIRVDIPRGEDPKGYDTKNKHDGVIYSGYWAVDERPLYIKHSPNMKEEEINITEDLLKQECTELIEAMQEIQNEHLNRKEVDNEHTEELEKNPHRGNRGINIMDFDDWIK